MAQKLIDTQFEMNFNFTFREILASFNSEIHATENTFYGLIQ
jgi:hypothetical protein